MAETRTVIGLMSGTSLDAVDAALLVSDGERVQSRGRFVSLPYPNDFRVLLHEALGRAARAKEKFSDGFLTVLERELTEWHARAVNLCLEENGKKVEQIDLLGFHGQTLFHDPGRKLTWQLGDGKVLANLTGIDVVCDFRSNDVAHGGQGAPFAPLYHRALFADQAGKAPLSVLNIGGVANLTWLYQDKILAFDCGPGNALLDDWVRGQAGKPFDEGGQLAAMGKANKALLNAWLKHRYFRKKPPKSLDRNAFPANRLAKLKLADGAATLTAFTVEAIAKARAHLPEAPKKWIVTGGGRHNPALMQALKDRLETDVVPMEAEKLNGDALEAEAFAYLAVRSVRKLPLSLPETTGVSAPCPGGRLCRPDQKDSEKRLSR